MTEDEFIERSAKVLGDNWRNLHTNEALGFQKMLMRALLREGLVSVPSEPEPEKNYLTVDIHLRGGSTAYGATIAPPPEDERKLQSLRRAGPNPPLYVDTTAIEAVVQREQISD